MTGLIRDFLKNCPYVDLAVAGQLIFLALFIAALFWVFRKDSQNFYARLANLPLDQGDKNHE